jgi:hypothetical protein
LGHGQSESKAEASKAVNGFEGTEFSNPLLFAIKGLTTPPEPSPTLKQVTYRGDDT